MLAPRGILVGFDFSPCALSALKQAARIGQATGAAVRVVHFLDPLVLTELEEALGQPGGLAHDLLADVQRQWAEVTSEAHELSSLTLTVEAIHPVEGMLAAARAAPTDLAVIGANSSGSRHRGAGTFATACVRKLSCDVLLVSEGQTGPFQNVLACVDFSESSRRALERAAALAQLDQARLQVLHVYDAPWRRLHYRAPTPTATPEFQRQYCDALDRRLAAFLEPLQGALRGLGVGRQLVDHPRHGEAIVELILKSGVDLAVLGIRGRSRFLQMLLGSTAERVLRDAACSIVAVRPPPA